MSKIAYIVKKFRGDSYDIINKAEAICEEYARQGFTITLRQLYYQFVARDFLRNTQENYKKLGGIINDARLAGLLDWSHLEDRTRNLSRLSTWDSPQEILRAVASQFRLDLWENQDYYVEVWVEKEALAGVIARTANALRVPYFACRGYVSQSEMHEAAMRFKDHAENGRAGIIVHLGDHDPSGIDMTRDIEDRFGVFGTNIKVERIALNFDQIQQYNPPPNPAKATDSRFEDYQKLFGDESWELDALEPRILDRLIRDTVLKYRNEEQWEEDKDDEDTQKRLLTTTSDYWPEVIDYMEEKGWTESKG